MGGLECRPEIYLWILGNQHFFQACTSPLNSKIIKPDFKTSSTFSNKSSEDAELLLKDREAYKIKLMSRVTDGNVRDSLEKVSFQTAIIKARNTQSYC